MVALCAGALDKRIAHTVTTGSLASYISDVPYTGQRLGLMAPKVLLEAGDIPHLAALIAAAVEPFQLTVRRELAQIAKERMWPVRRFHSRGRPSFADLVRTGLSYASVAPALGAGVAGVPVLQPGQNQILRLLLD